MHIKKERKNRILPRKNSRRRRFSVENLRSEINTSLETFLPGRWRKRHLERNCGRKEYLEAVVE
jgi:hypothetical protein